ncbi:DUF1028 domain-containing protein [Christiangramia sp. SM2212]|uniref:DUF1028 domain-containing protein n=1 Tax=Christiangramia sediminicola TaxID=3073267 RepID=A0ABU1ES65_9FLAO|nr:DUF1028 domain-containing protein [Christiangramia sp. SM2212]MDR5591216.1 DUF1028 domain-containing protein [Christiangramia sp. SM2212]
MKKLYFLLCLLIPLIGNSQSVENVSKDAFAHTFSIVARDTVTGEMAVGVQSHWFSVGSLVSWGKAGVGVVATQSFVNPAYGPEGLEMMANGTSAEQALTQLIEKDGGRAFRQVAFLDANGNVSGYTGEKCVEAAEDLQGRNFSVQANMMLNDRVVPAMAEAFLRYSDYPLAERVVEVLKAAQEVGGDIRGKQSAALVVVGPERTENEWEEKKIDLRVDDHQNPIQELSRLLQVNRAYEHMNKGDLAVEDGDMEKALKEYGAAEKMFPENLEMKYWKAVALANSGRLEEAKPIFQKVFAEDENWKEMTTRLPASGILTVSEEELQEIIE